MGERTCREIARQASWVSISLRRKSLRHLPKFAKAALPAVGDSRSRALLLDLPLPLLRAQLGQLLLIAQVPLQLALLLLTALT